MRDAIQTSSALVVAFDRPPGGLLDIGMMEHLVLGLGIFHPLGHRLKIHRTELPPACRVSRPLLEALLLLLVTHREPILEQDDAGADQQALEFGARPQELAKVRNRLVKRASR